MEIIIGGIVLGLTQVAKITLGLSKRFIPVTALAIALVVVFLAAYFSKTTVTWEIIQNAIVVGLSAVGLWEVGSKSIVGK